MSLVNQLRDALEERHLSQTDLAELTGIPYPRLRRLLRPDSNPSLDDALRVARVLDVPVGRLFRLEEVS